DKFINFKLSEFAIDRFTPTGYRFSVSHSPRPSWEGGTGTSRTGTARILPNRPSLQTTALSRARRPAVSWLHLRPSARRPVPRCEPDRESTAMATFLRRGLLALSALLAMLGGAGRSDAQDRDGGKSVWDEGGSPARATMIRHPHWYEQVVTGQI